MSGQELEKAAGQGLALRDTPIPGFLREIGLAVLQDPNTGGRVIQIPADVSKRVNVIDPVSSLVQADPNWTPRISVVALDPSPGGAHFYNQGTEREPKLAPTKQGLEAIGKAIGIIYTRTQRIPRAELDPGEIGYRATIGLRRSDGTIEEISRERVWNEEVERGKIEDAVSRSDHWEYDPQQGKRVKRGLFQPGSAPYDAEVRKRYLKELEDRGAKTESKAVNRAIRAAAQIKHTFTKEEALRPFLCIGFNFTPDYDDVETKRLLVAAGLNAHAALYGAATEPRPALPAADEPVPAEASAPDVVEGAGEADVEVEEPEVNGAAADSTSTSTSDTPEGEADAFAGEPPASDEQTERFQAPTGATDDPIVVAANAASQYVVPNGRYRGKSLAEVQADKDGDGWLRWAIATIVNPPAFKTAIHDFARVYMPEAYTELVQDGGAE